MSGIYRAEGIGKRMELESKSPPWNCLDLSFDIASQRSILTDL